MDITVIADGTDTLAVFGYQAVAINDEVRVGGYYSADGGFITMQPSSERKISVDLHDYSLTTILNPTALSVAQYNALDETSSANWILYTQINGTVNVNRTAHQATLTNDEDSMILLAFSEEALEYLDQYSGFRVNIRGVILPNMDDPENIVLMFLFNGSASSIDLDYQGESGFNELKGILEPMFRNQYESPTYFPGQFLDLPSAHPVVDVTLTYETFGDNADKYSFVTKRFADGITTALTINLHVYSIIMGTPYPFDVALHVDPAIILPIAELRARADSTTLSRVIQGVVTNVQAQGEDQLLLLADATGFVYVNTNNHAIAVGDEVVAVGYKMTNGNSVFLYNDPALTVDHIVNTDCPMPMTATPISLANFKALDISYVQSNFYYYELEGVLTYLDPEHTLCKLSGGGIDVIVYPTSSESLTLLADYVDKNVVLRGIAIVGGDAPNQSIFLAFLAISGTISEIYLAQSISQVIALYFVID